MLRNRQDLRGGNHALLAVSLALLSLIVRAYLAHRYYGFQTGDDLEIAEQAFHRALGLVHSPWDIRSLLIPDLLVAPVVKLAWWLGLRDPLLLAETARAPFVVLTSVNVLLLFALGRRWYDDPTALAAAALYAFHWMPLVYGSSLYPRALAVSCILGAAILLSAKPPTPARPVVVSILAGLLAALALTARYSEAMFILSLIVFCPAERTHRRRTIPALLGGFLLGVILFAGLYDRLTWGRWFASLRAFADLTFIRRDASSNIVDQPPWWYLTNLPHWLPLALLPLLVIAARRGELRRVVAFVILPVLLLSAIFHKELRYLQVVLPFALLLSARGFTIWYAQPTRRKLAVCLLVLAFPLALGRIGTATRRTTNAVTAALWMTEHRVPAVALSQPWAYGGRLFLGNDVVIHDLDVPPDRRVITEKAPTMAALALYTSDVDAAMAASLAGHGLSNHTTFDGHGGRAITVFYRR